MLTVFTLAIVGAATVGMALPSGPQDHSVIVADESGPRTVAVGQTATVEHRVGNGGLLPTAIFLEPGDNDVRIERRRFYLRSGERASTTVDIAAADTIGYYPHYVVEHRYLALLPMPIIRDLYRIHPWLPIVVIDALIGIPFYLLGMALVEEGRIRRRSRKVSSYHRLRRRVRNWL